MAILGIIALSGMIIRNSIILLDQIEIHRAEGQSAREAIINSATLRFRPIMLTAIAAILGMIPLMGSVFWSPLAIIQRRSTRSNHTNTHRTTSYVRNMV